MPSDSSHTVPLVSPDGHRLGGIFRQGDHVLTYWGRDQKSLPGRVMRSWEDLDGVTYIDVQHENGDVFTYRSHNLHLVSP